MKRQTAFSEAARDELAQIRLQLRSRAPKIAQEFSAAFRNVVKNAEVFPLSHPVWTQFGELDIRRVRIGNFAYFLFHIVYPSVDFNTGEALDVIGYLACRQEKQAEPIWGARDPFRMP